MLNLNEKTFFLEKFFPHIKYISRSISQYANNTNEKEQKVICKQDYCTRPISKPSDFIEILNELEIDYAGETNARIC